MKVKIKRTFFVFAALIVFASCHINEAEQFNVSEKSIEGYKITEMKPE